MSETEGWGDPNLNYPQDGSTNAPVQPPPWQPPTFEEYAQLTRAVAVLGQRAEQAEANQNAIGRAFEQLADRFAGMNTSVHNLANQARSANMAASTSQPTPSTSAPDDPRGVSRFDPPTKFDGKAANVEPFIREIIGAVRLSRATLPTDIDKAYFLNSYLGKGTPKDWFDAVVESEDLQHLLYDWDSFIDAFRAHFGDSDVRATALRKIEKLRQENSAANYTSRFRELARHIGYSEETKIDAYYKGLKEEVKDVMVGKDAPTKFEDYVKFVTKIDNHVHQRRLERNGVRTSSTWVRENW